MREQLPPDKHPQTMQTVRTGLETVWEPPGRNWTEPGSLEAVGFLTEVTVRGLLC